MEQPVPLYTAQLVLMQSESRYGEDYCMSRLSKKFFVNSIVLAKAFANAGLRALVGKVNMDQNSPR